MNDPTAVAQAIIEKARRRVALWQEIEDVVKEIVPDYHFLDFKVSTTWKCGTSPVGMCIFRLDDYGREHDCRYCHKPLERK